MSKKEILFYEDMKARKRLFIVFAVIFYFGAIMGSLSFIVYPLFPKDYSDNSIVLDISMTVFCWSCAILLTIFLIKAKRFKYYLEITENDLIIFTYNKIHKYNICDLKSWNIIGKKHKFTKFKLLFIDNKEVFIATKKVQELKAILIILSKITATI